MLFLRNQKGIIQFGVLGILVLVAGLFIASRLASNPDLTFFNIAEKAAGIQKKVELKKAKPAPTPTKKPEKKGIEGTAGVKAKTLCKKGSYCQGNIPGAIKCYLRESDSQPGYCCPPGQKDIGNGRCETFNKCDWKYCSLEKYSGSNSVCVDSEGRNRYCCSGGNPDDRIKACSRLLSNGVKLPVCGDSGCSANKVWDSQIRCVSTQKPEGQYCCPSGTKLWLSGECK